MSHHEQGEKLGHQTTCNDRMKQLSSLKRKNAHEKSQHYSVCILACHLEKLLVADDILHRIPVEIAQQVRMANAHNDIPPLYIRDSRTTSRRELCLGSY